MKRMESKGQQRLPAGAKQKIAEYHGPPPMSQGEAIPSSSGQTANNALFLQKVRESSEAVNNGDYARAIQLYTEAINLDPSNHILYTNRSAAFAKLSEYNKSLKDARRAKDLNPKWAKAYLREGVALQQLGQHGDALAAFATGLAQDSSNSQLLSGLVDSALKSPLKDKLGPTFSQLEKLKLNQSPFVIISVIGQELLAAAHYSASVIMLEAALQIGTCSLKLRGSVFSALSSAYWGLENIENAITYMQHDLSVAKSLGDHEGECRAHGNLGSAYFSKGHYKEALSNHRYQLALSMKLKDRLAAASALGSLGHVYTAIGDYPNALQSHKQCLFLMKQSNNKLAEAREIGNAGAVYLAMGEFPNAVECHNKHLEIAKSLKNTVEEARAYSNLGSAYHYKRDYEKAISFHQQVLKIAEQKSDKTLEARAYAGLGHAARCMHDYDNARKYHEKQLDNALQTKDRVAEGRACSNLGIIYHQLGGYKDALKLHEVHLKIARELGDRASQGRALGNLGNAYSALKEYDSAVKFHRQELSISSEVNDRHSEGATHGNLAVAYQCLGMFEKALHHYMSHLNISKELKDHVSEARASCNLGNYYSSRGDYSSAIEFYQQYLMLSQELHDPEAEGKACFNLGYAHSALGNHLEAVRYYEQDLSIARELKNQLGMARAYCNLGLAHKSLQNFVDALECQKKCLTLMKTMKNSKGVFRALGNIGDLTLKNGDVNEAIKIYNQQLQLAKQCNNKALIATAYGALGAAHRVIGQYDKALGFHNQELGIRQDMNDIKGECRAHGNLGNVHMSLGNYMNAYKCYEEQLEKSRELQDSSLEAQASGNLGITKMNMGNFEDAIGLFEQQLAMLEQVCGSNSIFEKGRAFGNLGDCYEQLGDFEESIKCHEQYLATAQQAISLSDQDKAYRGLGNAHRAVGNLQQSLVCFEKRLVVAHELNSAAAKASAYGELGCLHSLLGNFEQAISCLQHQLSIAQEMEDKLCEGDAACGLGGVYQQMGEYDKALEYHQMDLQIAESTENTACQCRAYGNLGLSHESLGNFDDAIQHQEQHLSIAAQMNDKVAKTLAYSSLGRVHHALNNHTKAVEYLKQGLQIAEQLGRNEDEAKIRHRLGLSLWGKGDLDECQQQLYKASDLFESIRRDGQFNSEYKMSLFDLQTACYQALQRVLVSLGRHEEALVIAERACTRAFIDYLLERQAGTEGLYHGNVDPPPITSDQIVNIISKQKALVLCYSIAAGYLYSWLMTPKDGIVKFHETNMADLETDTDSFDTLSMKSFNFGSCSVLDQYVGHIRESMGIESHIYSRSLSMGNLRQSSAESDYECDDLWQQQLEEIGDKLNAENDRTGFLRMVNRSHKHNSSTYSLSSIFSLSMNGLGSSFSVPHRNSLRNLKTSVTNNSKTPLSALYHLLIEPMEESIQAVVEECGSSPIDLTLVLQGELYLIPFSVLRKDQSSEYMFEKFNINVMPSVTALQNAPKTDKHGRHIVDSAGAIVVGNPKLMPSIGQHFGFKEIPGTEYEARIVGELLTCRPLIGQEATKGAVLHQIEQVEVIHFATHLSWKLSSIVLSPGDNVSQPHRFNSIDSDDSSSDISTFDGPSLSEYLLTAADLLNLKLHAKLVVLSSGYTDDRAGRINSDGVVGLTRALLSAGVQSVLYSLWPVPDQASKLLMRTLYTGLQEGQRVTQALSHAIKTVQCTKQFSHPSNWGGWVLVGHDIKLSSKVAQMGHAICELLQSKNQCREAMRVLLHLIEKSLQRIHQGIKNSMYTTFQSIENKVGGIPGWKDLLQAVGFRFEPTRSGFPPAVFFPQTDPGDRLTQASASLQALLGLPPSSVTALSKFLSNYEAGEANIRVMRDILSKMAAKDSNIDVQISVKLWRVDGCHEFLASLGLDLVEVGRDDVTLRLGKQSNRRQLQFALQSLVAVFDTQEAPKALSLDSSSSLESLSSSHSGSTSTSNFSKGSTPPLSPRGHRKKSLFNPAEMEKMRIMNKMHLMHQGGLSGRKVRGKQSLSTSSDPSIYLSHQSRIKNMYPPTGTTIQHQSDMNEIHEISENSESEVETGRIGSWQDLPSHVSPNSENGSLFMQVSTNSESEGSTIPEHRSSESDMLQNSAEQYMLSMNSSMGDKFRSSTQSSDMDQVHNGSFDVDENKSRIFNESQERIDRNESFEEQKRYSMTESIEIDDVFHRYDEKRLSDMSDTSGISDQFMTSNTHGLPTKCLETSSNQFSSESGINSEVTSSNQSDASQQSMDVSGVQLDPQELSLKILQEVGMEREALEHIQKQSFIASQQNSHYLRKEFQMSKTQDNPIPNMNSIRERISSMQNRNSSNTQSLFKPPTSQRSDGVAGNGSGVKIPPPVAAKPKPPPVPAKPNLSLSSSFEKPQNHGRVNENDMTTEEIMIGGDQSYFDKNFSRHPEQSLTGVNQTSNVVLRTGGKNKCQSDNEQNHSSNSSAYNSEDDSIPYIMKQPNSRKPRQGVKYDPERFSPQGGGSRNSSRNSSPSASQNAMTFSTFKPQEKCVPAQKYSNAVNFSRPESTTSLSSYCSTGSSVQSAIYRPKIMNSSRVHNSNLPQSISGSYPSFSLNLQSQNRTGIRNPSPISISSPDTPSPTFLGQNMPTKSILNSSQSSIGSNSSSKGKKTQKKVSFSDSEPSDLENSTPNLYSSGSPVFNAINNNFGHNSPNTPVQKPNPPERNYGYSSGPGPRTPSNGPAPPVPSNGPGTRIPSNGPGPQIPSNGPSPRIPSNGLGPRIPSNGPGPQISSTGPGPRTPSNGMGPGIPSNRPGPRIPGYTHSNTPCPPYGIPSAGHVHSDKIAPGPMRKENGPISNGNIPHYSPKNNFSTFSRMQDNTTARSLSTFSSVPDTKNSEQIKMMYLNKDSRTFPNGQVLNKDSRTFPNGQVLQSSDSRPFPKSQVLQSSKC